MAKNYYPFAYIKTAPEMIYKFFAPNRPTDIAEERNFKTALYSEVYR